MRSSILGIILGIIIFIGLIILGLGITLFFGPTGNKSIIIIFIGLSILGYGSYNLWNILNKNEKE